MAHKNILFTGIITLLFGFTLNVNSQLNPENKNEIIAYNYGEHDQTILKSTKLTYNNEINYAEAISVMEGHNAHSRLEAILMVQTEKDLDIEDWMLSSFEINSQEKYLEIEPEDEIELELWMTNISFWKNNSQNETK